MYEKLMKVRLAVQKLNLKKSGKNKHLNFDYYELSDFLTPATEELSKEGLCPVFTIETDDMGVEVAYLRVYGDGDPIVFQMPTADPNMGNPIQSAGAKQTYCKRYLYMNLLELSEYDAVDASAGEKPEKVKNATEKQVLMIKTLYDEENIRKMLEFYQINSLEELTIDQASTVIKRKKS